MSGKLYTERKIERRFFGLRTERPQAKPGQALVLTGSGGTVVLQPGTRATPGEAVWGAYDTVYEVDMGLKDLKFTGSAPAKGGDAAFQFTFSASYRVSNPAEVVDKRIEDAAPIIQRVVTNTIQEVTANFDIEDVQGATAAVREAIAKRKFDVPFVLETPFVVLEPDSKEKEFLNKRREIKRQEVLTRQTTGLTAATAENERLKHHYELQLLQQQEDFKLRMQKQRLDMYKAMIQEGLWSVLAQQLAQNPEDIGRVTDIIVQMHDRKVASDLAILQALIQSDRIEDRHVKDVVSTLVQNLQQNIRSGPLQLEPRSPSAPQLPPAGEGGSADDANSGKRS